MGVHSFAGLLKSTEKGSKNNMFFSINFNSFTVLLEAGRNSSLLHAYILLRRIIGWSDIHYTVLFVIFENGHKAADQVYFW